MRARAYVALAIAVAIVAGCGPHRGATGVPIDSRPTPPQPGLNDTTVTVRTTTPPSSNGSTDPARAAVVADTTAARAALKRCAGRKLLAEQESSVDATTRLLMDANAALLEGDVPRAASLARQAASLARSIGCP